MTEDKTPEEIRDAALVRIEKLWKSGQINFGMARGMMARVDHTYSISKEVSKIMLLTPKILMDIIHHAIVSTHPSLTVEHDFDSDNFTVSKVTNPRTLQKWSIIVEEEHPNPHPGGPEYVW